MGLVGAAFTVFVVGDERIIRSHLDLGEDGLALPDGGALGVGVKLTVKLRADGVGCIVIDLQRAALEVHAAVDDDGVIHLMLTVHQVLGAGGDVMLPAIHRLFGELTLEGQQDLLVLDRVILELIEIVLTLEGDDLVGVVGAAFVLHHGENAVGIVLVLLVGGYGEVQLRRGLALFIRGDDVRRDRRICPLQLEIPAALGEMDVLCQRHIHDAVLDGDVLMGDVLNDLTILTVGFQAPAPRAYVTGPQKIRIRHRDKEVPRALGVDDLGRHGGEAHLGHIAVAAGQQNIGHALAQLVGLGELTVGIRLVHADGDALIGGVRAWAGLKVERFGLALAHLQLGVGDGEGVGRFIVLSPGCTALVRERAEIAAAPHRQNNIAQILRALSGDVGEVHRHGEVGAALDAAFREKVVLGIVQPQTDRGGQIDRHAVTSGGFVVREHAVVGVEGGAAARSHAAQVEIQGVGAVGGHVFAAGVGEVQRFDRREVKEGACQMAPVTEGYFGGPLVAVDGVGRHRGAVGVIRGEQLLRNVAGQHLFLADRFGLLCTCIVVLIVAEVLLAQRGIVENARLDGLRRAAAVGHAEAQADHAGLVGAGVGEGDALGEGQAVHTPYRLDGAALLGDGDAAAAGVAAAKDVVLGGVPLAHAEGQEGSVILPVVIEQLFVVVGLFQAVTLHRAHGEAAVFLADGHTDVVVAEGVGLCQLVSQRGDGHRRQQADHHCCAEQP